MARLAAFPDLLAILCCLVADSYWNLGLFRRSWIGWFNCVVFSRIVSFVLLLIEGQAWNNGGHLEVLRGTFNWIFFHAGYLTTFVDIWKTRKLYCYEYADIYHYVAPGLHIFLTLATIRRYNYSHQAAKVVTGMTLAVHFVVSIKSGDTLGMMGAICVLGCLMALVDLTDLNNGKEMRLWATMAFALGLGVTSIIFAKLLVPIKKLNL